MTLDLEPTVGLALIARDEEATLPNLLASIAGAFDQVALLDTGSVDATVMVFEEWAGAQDLPLGYRSFDFTWCDDFAAARNAADQLLDTDWLANADADDVIVGAERLRTIAACARPEIAALQFTYDYLPGTPYDVLRERLHRRGRGRWEGRVHEQLLVDGEVEERPSDWALWVHRGDPADGADRNRRILRRWVAEEPGNPRAVALAASEGYAARNESGPPRCTTTGDGPDQRRVTSNG